MHMLLIWTGQHQDVFWTIKAASGDRKTTCTVDLQLLCRLCPWWLPCERMISRSRSSHLLHRRYQNPSPHAALSFFFVSQSYTGGNTVQLIIFMSYFIRRDTDNPHPWVFIIVNLLADSACDNHFQTFVKTSSISVIMTSKDILNTSTLYLWKHLFTHICLNIEVIIIFILVGIEPRNVLKNDNVLCSAAWCKQKLFI